ncbi:MAG TPA: enoyl-[acyl-carrier-protein] reductase [Polyangiaceae bacterium]|nr:enoyl-[acyl-carrier-protein] reductase [Polyangiaceae bacterium]
MKIDFTGKRILVAGVADDVGFGFAIAKQFAESGAKVCVAGWPPALGIFETMLRRGKLDESRKLSSGSLLEFERVYPLDAAFDTLDQAPQSIRENKRYAERGDFSIQGLADLMSKDFGPRPVDVVIHSLANGPEVAKPLLDTSREGYLAALSASSYSFVSMVRRFAPLMHPGSGSFLSLTYVAAERVIPRYGGGMSSAKAALEADTRYLAFEAGRRYGVRVNTISAGPYASRAANVTGAIAEIVNFYEKNSPRPAQLTPEDVASSAVFLSSTHASAITGTTLYVDNGYHAMGKGLGEDDLEWVMKAGDVPRKG